MAVSSCDDVAAVAVGRHGGYWTVEILVLNDPTVGIVILCESSDTPNETLIKSNAP